MTSLKNVGWVRPEAVTHQTETVRVASLGEVTVPKIDQSGPVGAGEFVYVDISSVDNKLKRITEPKTIGVKVAPSRAKQRLKAGDVLVSMTRPNLNAVALVPHELDGAVGSTGFHVMRATDNTEPRWLYYAVQTHHFVSAMSELVQGALYPAVRPKDIRAFEIPVPPLDQQERIVAEIEKQFSRLDEAVINLKRVKANLKRYKAAVLKAAVEGRLVETEAERARKKTPSPLAGEGGGEGASYETGAQLLQRILETRRSQWLARADKAGGKGKGKYKEPAAPDTTDLPELPEGWVWATVQQLADVQLGKMLDRQKHRSGKKLPYIRNINVRWDSIDTDDLLNMYFKDSELKRFSLQAGDVLVCEGGEPGRAAVWDGRIPAMMYQKAIHRVRFFADYQQRLLVFLLEYFAKSGRLERWFTGSTIKHFTRESFLFLPVPVPPETEQQRIVAEVERRLSVVEELETEVTANLRRAERLQQSILSQAFSGKLLMSGTIRGAETEQRKMIAEGKSL